MKMRGPPNMTPYQQDRR